MKMLPTSRRRLSRLPVLALLLACAACGDPEPPADGGGVIVRREPLQGPNVFDPAAIAVGDSILGMRVARAEVAWTDADSTYLGTVAFEGELELRGTFAAHPDPARDALCFFLERGAASALPRFPHDFRYPWFCFENQEEARRLLGPPAEPGTAHIVVRDYTTIRQFTNAHDTATLVRVLERGPPGELPPPG